MDTFISTSQPLESGLYKGQEQTLQGKILH